MADRSIITDMAIRRALTSMDFDGSVIGAIEDTAADYGVTFTERETCDIMLAATKRYHEFTTSRGRA